MEESSVGSESVQSSISSGRGSRAGGESIGEREQRGSGEATQEAPLLSLSIFSCLQTLPAPFLCAGFLYCSGHLAENDCIHSPWVFVSPLFQGTAQTETGHS